MTVDAGLLRIGELSRRTGVAPDLLRAWERRYGLLTPERTGGGFRLYPESAVARVESMQAQAGVPASSIDELSEALRDALDAYDEPRAQAVLDRMLATFTIEGVLRDALLPYLHELGERWERGEASVAQEHFASSIIRGRLLGLARGWGSGSGPLALLACPPGEEHDLGLLALGVLLHAQGWRVAYLGPDTPIETTAEAAAETSADCVVLAGVSAKRLGAVAAEITSMGRRTRVAIAGSGASEALAKRTGAVLLAGGPVEEAKRLSGLPR